MEAFLNYINRAEFIIQAELLLRIVISLFCGALIGYERTNRGKEAGIRTHTIVAVASCLMMVISQYGFNDFFEIFKNSHVDLKLDPSRVAAQIITGIGFLGAGMIFVHKNTVTGLTTAAGIWATAGIGMAFGGGMYFMGVSSTVVIVFVQWVLHKSSRFIHAVNEREFSFIMTDNPESMSCLLNTMKSYDVLALEVNYNKMQDGMLEVVILARCEKTTDMLALVEELYKMNDIKSVNM